MNWKELKKQAETLGLKDTDELHVQQNAEYAVSGALCAIECDTSTGRKKFILRDSNYKHEYQTSGFDRQ